MKQPRVSEAAQRSLVRTIVAQFANAGLVDFSLPDDQVWEQIRRAARLLPDDFDAVTDHTPNLLSKARLFAKSHDYAMAVLMYATWVEHLINDILILLSSKRKMRTSEVTTMLKEANLRAKSTWLLAVLGGKALSPKTVKRIQALADARNSFIHYKWSQPGNSAKEAQRKALGEAESVVRSLRRYRSKDAGALTKRSASVRKLLPEPGRGNAV